MNRLIFYLLLLSVAGCVQVQPDNPDKEQPEPQPEVDYGFHDDFYYYNDEKVYLTSCEDEYVIAFCSNNKDEVLDYIDKNGFSYLYDYPIADTPPDTMSFNVPDELKSTLLFWIKGKGDVNKIPHIFFADRTYDLSTPEIHKRIYSTNRFCVLCDEDADEDMFALAMRYASEFKVFPVLNMKIGKNNWVWFACTDESAGNAVEIANWLHEKGGFSNAEPSFFSNVWD